MAERGPRTGNRYAPDDTRDTRHEPLVRICDLAGRPRGTGFAVDHHGTVLTSHEAVDGLARLVLHAPGDRTCVVSADAVTALPDGDLALVRTEGLGLDPLPVTVRDGAETGAYVRIAAGGWREARVLGTSTVTYTATDRFHLVDHALELAIGTAGTDALRLGGGAAGGPVLDAATGAVVAVLGTALHNGHRAAGFAVPLRGAALREVLDRNAATVPAYGADLNLAGILELTATSVGSDGPGAAPSGLVERADTVREFTAFENGPAAVLGLVGPPGSGRTTELAALAARRTRGAAPAPTLWLRGADLRDTDASVADAAARALERAGRIVAASGDGAGASSGVLPVGGYGGELGDIGPERLARLARDAGRPLLLLLDSPEEMPPALAHRLPEWTHGTAEWLRGSGARLVVACRAEYWEQAGAGFARELLHGDGGAVPSPGASGSFPPCVWLGDLTEEEARRARLGYGIPERALAEADARHPLTLRLLAEVRAALPDGPAGRPGRDEVFAAHLDLMCLRVAVRLAATGGLRGTAVRRLAAQVAGQVHEAARRSLGPGQGELDRASFEAVFPWGPAAGRRFGGTTGWASAVLTEGLLVPAGNGYRFAHEELADWIQGTHLDLDAALHSLVHRGRGAATRGVGAGPSTASAASRRRRARASRLASGAYASRAVPVPRHRIGPVVQALLLLGREQGAAALACRLEDLVHALDALRPAVPAPPEDSAWWAGHLVGDVLLRVPDATAYIGLLRLLAERIVTWREEGRGVPEEFGPPFWEALPLPQAERVDLLRRLVVADQAPRTTTTPTNSPSAADFARHAADAGRAMAGPGRPVPHEADPWSTADPSWHTADGARAMADPARHAANADRATAEPDCPAPSAPQHAEAPAGPTVWHAPAARPSADPARFLDAVARLLASAPAVVQPYLTRWFDDERPLPATPDATVATAAQALLYAHRRRALDDLTEALVGSAHRRGDELLAVLAEEEPSALCRAVDRWAHDERPARHVAAVAYGLRAAPHVRTEADRELLRYAALALLSSPADCTLHGGALGLLARDPITRARYLPPALQRFAAGDPQVPASPLVAALATHCDAVLAAFRARLLRRPGPDTDEALRALADVTTPALARRVAGLVREVVELCPEAATPVAAYVDRVLEEHGPAARAVLHPLVSGLLAGRPPQVRAALAAVLAAPGSRLSRPLRRELLELLLAQERDPLVLDALLRAAADGAARGDDAERTRELVHRAGLLLVRTPAGATGFDRGLVDLARQVPGFAGLVAHWLTGAPEEWAAVVGPSTRRMIENLAGVRVPA
ncbi:trypsin-like peptidase domain-containing protein [Streptomyces sp. SAS_270]|uniref:trypsin-like peptidase domain-containing protein n=1 Tax=Streptomyces sp. SAS_270 TaxID=3412748 RepID=UPI00403D46DB